MPGRPKTVPNAGHDAGPATPTTAPARAVSCGDDAGYPTESWLLPHIVRMQRQSIYNTTLLTDITWESEPGTSSDSFLRRFCDRE
jgi:hypothetical protein